MTAGSKVVGVAIGASRASAAILRDPGEDWPRGQPSAKVAWPLSGPQARWYDEPVNIELSRETQARVDEILADGGYASPAAVVDEAIRLLAQRREAYWAEVNRKVAAGITQLDAGLEVEWSPELFDGIIEEGGGQRSVNG
jgi:Arc/MetJ-type ribon-helix-helix transcriptional regulator